MNILPVPANNDDAEESRSISRGLMALLGHLAHPKMALDLLHGSPRVRVRVAHPYDAEADLFDDWSVLHSICGLGAKDFMDAGGKLPLTAGEIDYFRRNHRGMETHVVRDFLISQTDLPSPLSELYALYQHRARRDAEAALFVAQSTSSVRVPQSMADLVAIGSFAHAMDYATHNTQTYALAAAFDTSAVIDAVNDESMRRLALSTDHPAQLLTLSPDDIGDIAATWARAHVLPPQEFLDKANRLAEARQDVTRLPTALQFITAYEEGDIPAATKWGERLHLAYARRLPLWAEPTITAEAVDNSSCL